MRQCEMNPLCAFASFAPLRETSQRRKTQFHTKAQRGEGAKTVARSFWRIWRGGFGKAPPLLLALAWLCGHEWGMDAGSA